MYLYANGCSMTYGSELCDDPVTKVSQDDPYRWSYSWPGRLHETLDAVGVFNDALPSGSNDRILRTTLRFVGDWIARGLPPEELLVVVGWSHPARREFFVSGDFRQVLPHHYYDIRPLNRLVRAYREAATSDTEASWRYFTQVAALGAFLDRYDVPHLFFNAITAPQPPPELRETCIAVASHERFLGGGDPSATMVTALQPVPEAWHVQHPNEHGHRLWAEALAAPLHDVVPHECRLTADDVVAAGFPLAGGTHAPRRHDRKASERTPFAHFQQLLAHRRRLATRADTSDRFIYP